jgi:hypothetical protein
MRPIFFSIFVGSLQDHKCGVFLDYRTDQLLFFSDLGSTGYLGISTFNVTGLHVRRKYVRYSTYYGGNFFTKNEKPCFFFENPGHVFQTIERKTLI